MRIFITGLLSLLATPALACEPAEAAVFSCSTGSGKTVHICQASTDVVYRFGTASKPEMTVRVPTADLKWQRDYGSGGGSEDLHFPNGAVTYQVTYAKHWDSEDHDAEASVLVIQPGKRQVEIACSAGTVRYDSEKLKATATSY